MTKFLRNLIVAAVFGLSLGLVGCDNDDEPIEETAEAVEEAADEAVDAVEETGEEIEEEWEEATDDDPPA